jgi:hypothetical protein
MTQREPPDLASAMYPSLTREAREREAAQQRQSADYQRRKAALGRQRSGGVGSLVIEPARFRPRTQ